jgi:CBS domain-containing protein
MHVSEILKNKGTDVVATRPGETIADTARLLAGRRIGAVLVTDDEALVGIISERDIVGAIGREGERALQMTVADLMTRDVVCCEPGDTLTEVMEMMTNRRIRHLPVMVAGKLEGVISIGDVVKYRLEEAQLEVDALRHYVAGSG